MYKLLIVDDESFVRNGLIKHVDWESLGVTTIEQAADGLSALKLAKVFMPHIILTDIRMPHLTGVEFAKQIRDYLPNCKIIFMSAYSDKEYLKAAIHLKAISYIEKPIDLEEVIATVKEATSQCFKEDDQKTKQNIMTNIIKENELITISQLVLDIIKKKYNEQQLPHAMACANIHLTNESAYFITIIRFLADDDRQIINLDLLYDKISTSIEKSKIGYIIGHKSPDCYVIIFYRMEEDKKSFKDSEIIHIIQQIETSLYDESFYFIGTSRSTRSLLNIPDAYSDAVVALQELYYKGINKYAIYQEIDDTLYELKESFYKKIEEVLEEENKAEFIQIIANITNEFKKQKYLLPNFSKEVYYKIIICIYEAAKRRSIKFEEMASYNLLWETLSKFYLISDVERYILNMSEKYFDEIQKAKGTKKIISDVIKIIGSHYQDPNLSIKIIAQMLYLSDTYLCFIFKKETNKTINQFIREIRIEKAKELFLKSNYKIYDIANLVGYTDHNYFTKIFKKTTHMTPSEYKEKHNL